MEFPFSLRKRLLSTSSVDRNYPPLSYDPSEFHSNTFLSFPRYFQSISGSSRDTFPALDDDFPRTSQIDSKYYYSHFTSYSRSEYVSGLPTARHYGSPESPPATDPDSEPPYAYSPRPNIWPPQSEFSPGAIRGGDNNSSSKKPQPGATYPDPYDQSPHEPEHPKVQAFPIQANPVRANPVSSYQPQSPTYSGPYNQFPNIRPKSIIPSPSSPINSINAGRVGNASGHQPRLPSDPYNKPSYGYNPPDPPTNFPSQSSIPGTVNINTGNGKNDSGEQQNGDVNIDYGNQQNGGVKIDYKVIHVNNGDYVVHKKRRRRRSKSRMPSRANSQNYFECYGNSEEIMRYKVEDEDEDEEIDEYIICGTVDNIVSTIRQDAERERRATKEECGTSAQYKIDISGLQGYDQEKLRLSLNSF